MRQIGAEILESVAKTQQLLDEFEKNEIEIIDALANAAISMKDDSGAMDLYSRQREAVIQFGWTLPPID